MVVKMYTATAFLCVLMYVSSIHLPPHIPPCKPSDEACLKSSAESAFSNFVNGNEGLGIPPLDPIALDPIELQPQPGPRSIYQKFENTVISGITKAKVSKFTVNLKDCHLFMEMVIPEVHVKTNYEIKGQFLLLPVDAKGVAEAKFTNFLAQTNVDCEFFKDQDVEFLRATTSEVKFTPTRAEFNLGKLINGNDQLDQQVHKVVEEDPLAFFEVMRPSAETTFSWKVKEIVNDFFTKVPRHELFKD